MPRPVVSDVAEELYASLGPWQRQDTAIGGATDEWHLLELCEALAGGLQGVEDIIRDTDEDPGWSIVLDVDRAPIEWLPWLGQFVGVRLPPGLSEEEQRARIKNTDGFQRGSPEALKAAARSYLTGSQSVFFIERFGSPYRLRVATLITETPDPGIVERALLEQKPAGIVLTYVTVAGHDYNTLAATHVSYASLPGAYATYADMAIG
jgi:hypothetical protein